MKETKAAHSTLFTFWTIFSHNVMISAAFIILGFVFGIFPAIYMWVNGLLMGFVVSISNQQAHIPAWKVFVYGMLPHGIFELTAIIWAAALGMANGFAVLGAIGVRGREPAREAGGTSGVRFAFRRSVRGFAYIVGMLFVAAIIESTLTPIIINWGIHHGPTS